MNIFDQIPELHQSIYKYNGQLIDLDKIITISVPRYYFEDRTNWDELLLIIEYDINFQGSEEKINIQEWSKCIGVKTKDPSLTQKEWAYIHGLQRHDKHSFKASELPSIKQSSIDELSSDYIKLIEVWNKYKKLCAES